MSDKKMIPLLVTTEHKGVFFGYGEQTAEKIIRLKNVRMCVFWSQDVRGILGLAANGPSKNCKVTPAAPAMTLQGVTSVTEVSEKAEAQWKLEPWC